MSNLQSIFLVGPMGAGKSTIGRLLARELGLVFTDSDREIEERSGANIPWIFDVEGEAGFREREARVIDDLSLKGGLVLATGGGVVMREENRQALRSRGTVVYLQTSVDEQLERTSRDRNRPLLQTEDPQAVLAELMAVRDPLYREVADLIVSTDRQSPKAVVQSIVEQLSTAS